MHQPLGATNDMLKLYGTGRVISNFAYAHFAAAQRLSTHVSEVEAANAGLPFGPFFEDIRTYCAASIICAAASLEALINEIYLCPGDLKDRITDFDTFFWGGRTKQRQLFFWNRTKVIRGLEREPALKKYKKAARILGKAGFSDADPEYCDAEVLLALRHYLIHFKPVWDAGRRNTNLEAALAGKFSTSPFVDRGADFISMKCMSAGCADWSVTTTANFVKYFGSHTEVFPEKLAQFATT
jgi:hypothetical protein